MDRTQQQRADCVQMNIQAYVLQTYTQVSVTCNNLHHTLTPYVHTLLHFLFSVCLLFKWFVVTVLLHHHLVVLLHKLDLKTSTGKWVWWGEGPVHEQLLVDNGLRGRGVARGVARVWQGVWQGVWCNDMTLYERVENWRCVYMYVYHDMRVFPLWSHGNQ